MHPIDNAEEVEQDQEAEEEAPVEAQAGPIRPTSKEKDDHNLTHANYRSWCPHCVKGRGKVTPHRRSEEGGRADVPQIVMDYCFPGQSNETTLKILVVKDKISQSTKAMLVPTKGGGNQWVVKEIVKTIDDIWGRK